jgi:hypothetical protein
MMRRLPPPATVLELGFSDKHQALRLLTALAADPRVSVFINRARITEHSAWLRLELEGESPRIVEVATLLNDAATIKDPSWRPVTRAS